MTKNFVLNLWYKQTLFSVSYYSGITYKKTSYSRFHSNPKRKIKRSNFKNHAKWFNSWSKILSTFIMKIMRFKKLGTIFDVKIAMIHCFHNFIFRFLKRFPHRFWDSPLNIFLPMMNLSFQNMKMMDFLLNT